MIDLLRGAGMPPMRTRPAGKRFVHAHETVYPWDSFNPRSGGRYSAALTTAARAAFYMAESSTGALFETVIRNLAPNAVGQLHVPATVRARWALVTIELLEDLHFLEISNATVRDLTSDSKLQAIWKQLCVTQHYKVTHEASSQLISAHPSLAALGWFSAQINAERVFLLHQPPSTAGQFKRIRSVSLDTPAGRQAIQRACGAAGYEALL